MLLPDSNTPSLMGEGTDVGEAVPNLTNMGGSYFSTASSLGENTINFVEIV